MNNALPLSPPLLSLVAILLRRGRFLFPTPLHTAPAVTDRARLDQRLLPATATSANATKPSNKAVPDARRSATFVRFARDLAVGDCRARRGAGRWQWGPKCFGHRLAGRYLQKIKCKGASVVGRKQGAAGVQGRRRKKRKRAVLVFLMDEKKRLCTLARAFTRHCTRLQRGLVPECACGPDNVRACASF